MLTPERIAQLAHHGQVEESTGDPYIEHVRRVANAVMDADRDAAWLHDVIEDSPWTSHDLLGVGIGKRTVRSVRILTRRKMFETYAAYIDRVIKSGDETAIRVKWADLKDHLRPNCPERLRKRYERALPLIEEAMKR